MRETDFVIVGAGIIGLSITRELVRRFPGARMVVLEKEAEPAFHASGRNSGVLHAGFYYSADSLKARFTLTGNKLMTDYCLEHGLPINRCGKVVVATSEAEIEGIHELKRRGDRNGVDLKLIDPQELNEIEPNARTVGKALFSPTTSSVDPRRVCRRLAADFPASVEILFGRRFIGRGPGSVRTDRERIGYRYLFNAAGLYADRVARTFGAGTSFTMIPFKGIYLRYNDDGLLQRHVYPVPNLRNPFLGVHFTKTVDGHVKIGPTAIPAFWRENYDFKSRFDWREFGEIAAQEARLFLFNHFNFRQLALEEMRKYSRRFFISKAQALLTHLDAGRFGDYTRPGIRAQLLNTQTSELVMDFLLEHAENSTHVLNAVSPAFTSAFSFARHIVDSSVPRINIA
ncbi:MAG TPA: L-2-hydroxyglutarate oxidase [Desulfobacterales bacterium]|nr:L-2-hydroxyglutarate oxidase [Desulfobacterales bacterium]